MKTKRILSILMAMALCLAMLPVSAFATTEGGTQDSGPVIGESGTTCTCNAGEGAAHAENCPLYEESKPELPACAELAGCADGVHDPECPLYEEPATECICTVPCTGDAVNTECPICGAEGADLSLCKGTQPDPVCGKLAGCADGIHDPQCPLYEEPAAEKCICSTPCTEVAVNADCPVCGVEGADLTACKGQAPAAQPASAEQVQALIDALPSVEELKNMTVEEQQTVYEKLQTAYDAYNALTDEQKAQVTGVEIFEELFAVFNRMVRPLVDHQHPVCGGENCTDPAHNNVTWTAWESADALPTSSGSYYLTGDVTLSATWKVPGTTQLCLNGHSITYTGGSVIRVPGSTLVITDCAATPGKITGGTGTTFTANYSTKICGGGVFLDGGTFQMYGGEISGNHTEGGGSAVYCNGGRFDMYGGKITGNKIEKTGRGWGAVCLENSANMTMSGGEISDNRAAEYNTGVMNENSTFTMSDTASITGHYYGVYCWPGTFNMNGGKVESTGDSVILNDANTKMTMTGGEISSSGSHGIYMPYWGYQRTLTISGGQISGADNNVSYGIYLEKTKTDASIVLSGNPEISSIYLDGFFATSGTETLGNAKIVINGALTYTTPIPIATKVPGAFTSGWSDKMGAQAEDFSKYFTSKNEKGFDLKSVDGELYLVPLGTDCTHDGHVFDKKLDDLGYGNDGVYAITENGNYYLADNYAIVTGAFDHTLYIGDGSSAVTVNLCLNGYNLEYGSSDSGPVIIVRENATLNLYDCEAAGAITGGKGRTAEKEGSTYSFGGGVLVYGTLNMYGGSITGNSANADGVARGFGGGVYVAPGGAFNLHGGSITNNTAKTTGGGISVAGADDAAPVSDPITKPFEIGGAVIGNWNNGGTMDGDATLQRLSRAARAPRSSSSAVLNLYGGSITGNTSGSVGGGVNARGTVTAETGSAIDVTGNTANGEASNLYFPAAYTNLAVNGIPAEGSALGVRMEAPGQFAVMGNGVDEKETQPFFTSDDPNYGVLTMVDGLKLANQYDTPNISVNYVNETLTGFEAGGSYTINGETVTVAADNTVSIHEDWFGTSISIVRTGSITSSDAQTLSIPARPAAPTAPGIDYVGEKLTGAAENMQYSTNGVTWTDCSQGMDDLSAFGWTDQQMDLYFRTKAEADKFASKYAKVTIPARPSVTAVQGVNETVKGRNDGRITGLTAGAAYEISSDNGQTWKDATLVGTEITGLAPGSYQVRAKATSNNFESTSANVEIATGDDPTYTLNITAPAFDAVYPSYTQPEAKAITITSTGNSNATISSVTVDNQNFVIGGSGASVPAGSSIITWTIQPAAGLGVGTHTAAITVSYDGGATSMATVSFTVKSSGGGGGSDSSDRDDDEYDFWMEVKDEISDADSGDVIKVNAKGYDKMPYSVMTELRKNSGVSLVIRWNGGEDIIIPAGQARPAESLRIYYPLSLLEELYAGKSLTDPATGKPVDPSKLNPNTGGVLEIDAPAAADAAPNQIPQVTDPQRGTAESPALAEKGVEKAIPGVFEPEEAPAVPAGSNNILFALLAAIAAAAVAGVCYWKKRHA